MTEHNHKQTEAPEKIWVDSAAITTDVEGSHVTSDPENIHTEYIRSDIAERQIAELRSVIDTCEDSIAKLELKVQHWQEKADSAREYGKEARIRENQANDARIHEQILREAAEAENARLKALPLKDEVERVLKLRSGIDPKGTPKLARKWMDDVCDLLSRIRAGAQEGWRTQAADDLLAERKRQVEVEGWTPEHDDAHDRGELAAAASCYAYPSASVRKLVPSRWATGRSIDDDDIPVGRTDVPANWPDWDGDWWKPSEPRRNLVKAGALILAEIERLDRAAPSPEANEEPRP